MTKLNSILNRLEKMTPETVRLLVKIRALFKPVDQLFALMSLSQMKNQESFISGINDQDRIIWLDTIRRYLLVYPRNIELVQSFLFSKLEPLSFAANQDTGTILGLCVVKNDLDRLKMTVEHHRKLGIKQFVILDNGSDDGTLEWLLQQPDIDTYQTKQKFSSSKKYGWINQLLARYGFNRWYVYFDSDEKIIDPSGDERSLSDLTQLMSAAGLDRLAALMIDLYSDQKIYTNNSSSDQPIDQTYIYFDKNSYKESYTRRGRVIHGGPRKRVFSPESSDSPLLIKHPLFKFTPGMLFESAHYLFPYRIDVPVALGILHYKFIAGDLARHRQIAEAGIFQGGSREYKRYLESYKTNQDISFMQKDSGQYTGFASIKAISVLEKFPSEKQ